MQLFIFILILIISVNAYDYHSFLRRRFRDPRKIKQKHTHDSKDTLEVKNVALYYEYRSNLFKKADSFIVRQKNQPNCLELYMEVLVDRDIGNGSKAEVLSYIDDALTSFTNQAYSFDKICWKIRRFYVNKDETIISVFDYYHLVNIDEADTTILEELWYFGDYWTYFRFYFNLYNEYYDRTDWYAVYLVSLL